jgi:hypothetical protein
MLTFSSGAGYSRRDFLQIGGLTLGGLSLPALLAARALGEETHRSLTTGKSVIFLFQQGGPSQFETFDPKMTAPEGIRSATGEIKTTLPGITFGGTMTQLARHAHRLAIVRSYLSGGGNHDIKPLVSKDTLGANLGSLYSRIVGPTRPNGMPTNAAVFPDAVDPKGPAVSNRFGTFASTGALGASYAPFIPGAGGDLQRNLKLNMKQTDLDDRRALLARLDNLKREIDSSGAIHTVDRFQQQAIDVILGGVADAFDLNKENPKTVARYDTSHFTQPHGWAKVSNGKKGWYNAHGRSLGKLLLLARRLCEAGCGFVTVNTAFVWDMHADKNNLGVKEGMEAVGNPFDHAVSAFVEDLEARGLSDRILLVATGEMGRTYKINKRGGRDHWGRLTPLLVHGGGLPMGQVIGRSDSNGGSPASEPITAPQLIATIMNTVFDVGVLRITPGVPKDVLRVTTGSKPIAELF